MLLRDWLTDDHRLRLWLLARIRMVEGVCLLVISLRSSNLRSLIHGRLLDHGLANLGVLLHVRVVLTMNRHRLLRLDYRSSLHLMVVNSLHRNNEAFPSLEEVMTFTFAASQSGNHQSDDDRNVKERDENS